VAERIRGARFVELPGDYHIPLLGDHDSITNEVEDFSPSAHRPPVTDRVPATVLFPGIVASTDHAAALGDRARRDLREAHHAPWYGAAM